VKAWDTGGLVGHRGLHGGGPLTSISYLEAPGTGSQVTIGDDVTTPGFPTFPKLSITRRFLIVGTLGLSTLSNVFVKLGPSYHVPALPFMLIARTRQKYLLFASNCVGENVVVTSGSRQQTFEPTAQSFDGLISTSYRAAPGTGVQVNRGS